MTQGAPLFTVSECKELRWRLISHAEDTLFQHWLRATSKGGRTKPPIRPNGQTGDFFSFSFLNQGISNFPVLQQKHTGNLHLNLEGYFSAN